MLLTLRGKICTLISTEIFLKDIKLPTFLFQCQTFVCEIDGKQCENKDSARNHRKKHENRKKFTVPCAKRYLERKHRLINIYIYIFKFGNADIPIGHT